MSIEIQTNLANNIMKICQSLSFYSPLIIFSSITVFSMFTTTINKLGYYLLWFFTVTCIRYFIYTATPIVNVNPICDTFIPLDYTYSTYILTFTMTYFVFPMILVSNQSNTNIMNYGIIAFFICYIVLDLFIKNSLQCIPKIFSSLVIGNLFGGLLCGIIIVMLMYGSNLKNYLYINDINSNKEVCSMPSKQQFKCSIYKNGELVSSSIN